MTKKDIKELPNFIDTNDIIKLTDFLDKYHVNYKIVENSVETDTVKLYDRGITQLPDSIGHLTCNELFLNNNNLTQLPDNIVNLKCKHLFLNNNNLTQLPDNIGNLKCNVLSLSDNQLTSLPESIGDLKCNRLYLYNNPLTSESKELLEKMKSNGVGVIYQ